MIHILHLSVGAIKCKQTVCNRQQAGKWDGNCHACFQTWLHFKTAHLQAADPSWQIAFQNSAGQPSRPQALLYRNVLQHAPLLHATMAQKSSCVWAAVAWMAVLVSGGTWWNKVTIAGGGCAAASLAGVQSMLRSGNSSSCIIFKAVWASKDNMWAAERRRCCGGMVPVQCSFRLRASPQGPAIWPGMTPLPDLVARRAHLALKHGGLGLRSAAAHAPAAYFASGASSMPAVASRDLTLCESWLRHLEANADDVRCFATLQRCALGFSPPVARRP